MKQNTPTNVNRDRLKRKTMLLRVVIGTFLVIYSFVTLIPFYFLFVRAFVPTKQATELHLWIPEADTISMNAQLGNISTYYNIDLIEFKEKMGIAGYINPRLTLQEIAEQFQIPDSEIKAYFQKYILFNGMYALFKGGKFFRHLMGTALVVSVSIIGGSLLGLATGSVLAGFKKRWHVWVYYLYLVQIAISPVMIILPVYLIITRYLHLYDNYLALILLYVKGGALSTMIFTAFVASIPKELKESIELDGGNHFHYYVYILLPLAKTPIAVFSVASLPLFWNDLLYGFLFLSPEKATLMPFVNSFSGAFATNYQAVYSGLLMSTIPLLLVYLIFRRLFVRSALSGSMHGL